MEKLNSQLMDGGPAPRGFVKVAPPTVNAGLGNALRQAFRLTPEARSIKEFEDLLARLDR